MTGWLAGAQLIYSHVYDFGFTNQMVAGACGLIEAGDGWLYGVSSAGGWRNAGLVFRLSKDGTGWAGVWHFGLQPTDGRHPAAPLLEGADGALYGTTTNGGQWSFGAVFKLRKDGSGYQILHHFSGADEARPVGPLIQAHDGALYGCTTGASGTNRGAVFRLNPDGTGYTVLRRFGASPNDGAQPIGPLVQGPDRALYGVTSAGGAYGWGTVFKLNVDGTGYSLLCSFGSGTDGRAPRAGLLLGRNGVLYGTTTKGGAADRGTVFRLNRDGSGYSLLYSFTSTGFDGKTPEAPLVEGPDGLLYGTTTGGGRMARGTVFRLAQDGTGYAVLHSFMGSPGDGQQPAGALVAGTDGRLYGVTSAGGQGAGGVAYALTRDGSAYTVLQHFHASGGDGHRPTSAVLAGADGWLYGTTSQGGAAGTGLVFKLHPDTAHVELLHSFTGLDGDGQEPVGALVQGRDGALYGVTERGGAYAFGTVFKLNKDGCGYRLLRSLGAALNDGQYPTGLIEGSDGALYGTTSDTLVDISQEGYGTVFKLNKDGSGYTVLRRLAGPNSDGAYPVGALLEASDGLLYGVTYAGGSRDNFGAVYRLAKNGSNYRVIYAFRGGELAWPLAGVIEGSDGWLYGTTTGATLTNGGAVFRLNKDGTGLTVLHTFTVGTQDGFWPEAALQEGPDGALYGTTPAGGAHGCGTIFKLNKDGSGYTVLWHFRPGDGDGQQPLAGLARAPDGVLYGTTAAGGQVGLGTVWRLGPARPNRLTLTRGPGRVIVRFGGNPSQRYALQRSADLRSWQTLWTGAAPLLPWLEWVETAQASDSGFYRALQSPP